MFKNILKLFTGTFISRIFGFVREIIVARFFGTDRIADAFTLALIFPNLFRQVLGEDMVERAFIPPFKTIYDKGDKEKSWRYISIVFNWFFLMLLVVTFLLYLIVPLFFSLKDSFPHLFGFIFSNQDFDYDLTLKLILILLPFTIFIGIAAFVGGILNYFEKNWIFGLAPAMLSIGVVLGIYLLYPSIGGYSIAVGYVLGAFLQMLIQFPFLFNKKFKRESNLKYSGFKTKDPNLQFKSIKRESRFITWNALFDKSQEIFGRFFAASLFKGATSSLFYAARLFQLPFGILSLTIARGINPTLNKLKAQNNYTEFNETFHKGLNLYVLMFVPVTVIMYIASPELVDLAFRRGEFSEESLILTSKAFMMYSLGLLPMSLFGYYKRVLSLFDKNKYALWVSIIGAVMNIIFALFYVKAAKTGHEGIALASSTAFFINMIILGKYLNKEIKEYVSQAFPVKILPVLLILSAATILVYTFYNLDFYETKLISIISITIKSIVVTVIFGIYYFFNSKIRHILRDFLRKQ